MYFVVACHVSFIRCFVDLILDPNDTRRCSRNVPNEEWGLEECIKWKKRTEEEERKNGRVTPMTMCAQSASTRKFALTMKWPQRTDAAVANNELSVFECIHFTDCVLRWCSNERNNSFRCSCLISHRTLDQRSMCFMTFSRCLHSNFT